MLRIENLVKVYKVFPSSVADFGTIKTLDLTKPDNNVLTTYFLIEAERFWMATILQLVGYSQLYKAWLHTWADVTLYYANFFAMNGVMRLSGRTLTHAKNGVYRIRRKASNVGDYQVTSGGGGADHKAQWNYFYDLIQQDVTDDRILKDIFNVQLEFRHDERKLRQSINYDLEVGFDERHYTNNFLSRTSEAMTSIYPFEDTIEALATDTYSELAAIIYIWRHTKLLLEGIADKTNFGDYWDLQKTKLAEFVTLSPINDDLKEWVSTELNS